MRSHTCLFYNYLSSLNKVFYIFTHLIIVCPKCSKAYHVDPNEMPIAKMADRKKKGKGWFLSCQYCFHEWWHSAPHGFTWYEGGSQTVSFGKTIAPFPYKFNDCTNLESLKNREPTEQEKKERQHQLLMQNSYSPFYDTGTEKGVSIIKEKVATSITYKIIVVFLLGLICVSIAVFFNFIKIEKTSSFLIGDIKSTIQNNQKNILSMQINNITFEKNMKTDHQSIHVKGEILNLRPTKEILPKLKISVWGMCPSKTIASSLSGGEPYCLIKSWEHDFNKQMIEPACSFSFESEGAIPCDSNPIKVDVIPDNNGG
jgi:hypothetical protein